MELFKQFAPLSLHPLFWGLLGLMCGITGQFLPLTWPHYTFITMISLCIAWILQNYKPLFLFFFCIGLGYFLAWNQHQLYMNALLPSSDFLKASIDDVTKTGNPQWAFRTRISWHTNIICLPIFKKYAYVYSRKKPYDKVGDIVLIEEISFKRPPLGDFKKYLIKEGVCATAFSHCLKTILIERPAWSWIRFLHETKNSLLETLKRSLSPLTFSLFCSLFMGETHRAFYKLEEERVDFKIWGIVHHLARSGLHLAIFIYCWFLLLSFLPLPFWAKHTLLGIVSVIYFLLSTPSISFIRAFHLLVIFTVARIFKLPIDAVHAVTLSALLTLLHNPYQLFFLDFQLSFFLTFCLAWVSRLDKQKRAP